VAYSDDGHEAAGQRAFAAVAEEEIGAAGGAEIRAIDIAGTQAGGDELRAIGLAKIEANIFRGRLVAGRGHVEPLNGVGFVAGARLVEIIVSIGELSGEFGDKLDANFIATRPDRRTERGAKVIRFAAEFESHTANSLLGDASEGAAPTGMNSSDYTLFGIDDENGDTIGRLNAEQQATVVCEGGVALAGLGCRLREKMNDVRMDLFQREQGGAFGG
jgi:hypothetical protein